MPGIALLVIVASPWIGAGIGAEEVPPGWAARFSGGFGAKDVTTHAEHAAFAVKEGETLHPEVAADGFVVQYDGELRIARKGRYRFGLDHAGGSATLTMMSKSGGARLGHVAAQSEEPELSRTDWIEINPGTLVVSIKFTRAGAAPARLRTSWEMERDDQGNGFADEPIPARLASVPSQKSGAVARDLEARQGRVLLSELGCTSCHDRGAAANAVDRRAKSSLERVAARASEAWLRRWILAPQELHPGSGMPAILGSADPAKSKSAADALVELLRSLSPPPEIAAPSPSPAPPPAVPASDPLQVALGSELYHAVGCVGCHGPFEAPAVAFRDEALSAELPAVAPPSPFGDLAGKWNVGELAAFLRDPRATRPHARMPALDLSEPEAAAIANALVEHFGAPAAPEAAPAGAPRVADPKKAERGRFLFNMIGCANCHVLGAGAEAKSAGAMPPLAELRDGNGCLAIEAAQRGMAPRYELDDAQRAALSAGLASAQRCAEVAGGETPAPAPLDATQRALAAFHCTACHERDKQGGPAPELLPYYRSRVEADLGDEGHLPPRLDGVGLRLQSPWLARVVGEGARARPYFWTRMPAFGTELGGSFAAGLAALEGEWRSDEVPDEETDEKPNEATGAPGAPGTNSDEALAVAGRKLAGTGGLNCVTCHSFGERPSAGTPGLDFTQLAQRIRKEWWQRYALSPLRFKPGTRMPTFFDNGRSAAVSILDGDATRQVDALWHWFEQAGAMPAPEGVPTGERMVLAVGDRPKVFRTFLERAGSRGIAVGFPDGLHFAFDAEQIRLCEAWSGEFLDVAPVWNGRGGNVAPQLGPVVWSAPPGPALLLEKPQGEWPADSGRNHGLKFKGYRLDAAGAPTFLWELRKAGTPADDPPQADAVQVEETFRGDPRPDVLFVRTFRVTNLPPGASIWVAPGTESATARDAQPLVLEFEVKS